MLIAVGLLTIRSITKPLNEMMNVTNKLAEGDLSVYLDNTSNDEVGRMQTAMNGMVKNLWKIVGEITVVSRCMAINSEEVSATSRKSNATIADQSAQVEQSAAAVTEVSLTILDDAKNATDASDAVKESVTIADEGKKDVEKTVTSMTNISHTIESSSQTIEALCESSKQIGDIKIQQETAMSVESMKISKAEAEEGVKLAEQAKGTLDKIVDSSERCLDMVQLIAAATEEQSAAIEQVTLNMENVAYVFTSRDVVSQIDGSINDLESTVNEMAGLVSWIKDETGTAHSSGTAEMAGKENFPVNTGSDETV